MGAGGGEVFRPAFDNGSLGLLTDLAPRVSALRDRERELLEGIAGAQEKAGGSRATLVNREQVLACGVTQFMYRDVDRDGTLEGSRFDALIDLNCLTNGNLIVEGGIGNISHLRMLASLGIEAVVLGTSIYTGAIDYGAACAEFHH